MLEELQVLTLTVPEDVARLKAEHRSRNRIVEQLAITVPTAAACSGHSISLSWEAPTKNRQAPCPTLTRALAAGSRMSSPISHPGMQCNTQDCRC